MGGFSYGMNLPGLNLTPEMLQRIQQASGTAMAAPAVPQPAPAAPAFNPASGPLTDEARMEMERADAENRQALRDAGVNVEGMSPEQYQATIQAFGEWSNLPENRAYRNQRSAIGNFVDSIGGPAGLFALTAGGIFLAGGGLGAMGGAPAASTAAAPSVTAPTAGSLMAPSAATGAGAAGTGSAINIAAGTGLASPAAGSINLAATGMPAFTGGAATGAGAGLGTLGAASAAPAAGGILGGASPAAGGINLAAGTGAASPAAGAINLGAGQAGGVLGGGAGAVSTSAPLTMSGLLGGTSPAAGAINLGAAGLGTAAGGAGMGGISGLISGAQNIASGVGNFLGSPLGQGLVGLGQAGLGFLGQQEQADLARELAAQAQFRPYNVQGPLGAVTVEGQNINISPTAQQQALQESLFGLSSGALGRATDPTLQNIFAQTPGQLQQLTQQFIGQETAIPGAAQALQQQLQGIGGTALGMGTGLLGQAQNLPSAMAAVSPLVGGAPTARSPEEALTSQAARSGLGLLAEGAGGARDITGTLAGAGGELLRGAQGAPTFNQLATERLSALRGAARTGEERTTQSALERLFSQGRLGTTGGQRALGELARAQEEADIARTVAAQDFAQQQQNIAANQAIQRGQLGLSALGGALGGQQFLTGTGQNLLGMGTQVGQFGRTLQEQARGTDINTLLAATGQDVGARMAQAGLGQGLFGLGARLPSTIFGAQQAADQARLARGAQRIAAAEGLFGFGQGARAGELGMGLQAMQAQQAQFNPLIQLANIASGMGSAQSLGAQAGANLQYGAFGSPYTAASTYLGSLLG